MKVDWSNIKLKSHHGIAVPLFSLRTSSKSGIGEYLDLIPLIDWCKQSGFEVIQLLPLNDTGYGTSPYSALSAFALNPIYITLSDDFNLPLPLYKQFQGVNYWDVREKKMAFLKSYYELHNQQIIDHQDFKTFCQSASYWLEDYCLFMFLKAKHHMENWESWPAEERTFTKALLGAIKTTHSKDFLWHAFLQYLCFQQMQQVKEYAASQEIYIMGDVPILIDKDSADVWRHRNLFRFDFTAGAPPDTFAKEGQNWGFPLYNWPENEKDNYTWWTHRLQWGSKFYHIYRIDHVVGFFRIWAIPLGQKGNHGHYIPEDSSSWMENGKKLMTMMLQASDMLAIGEDLGVIPPEVRACLKELGICGTKVMRWERKWNGDQSYILPEDYIKESMTTVSTHDSETLYQWWRDYPDESKQLADQEGWIFETSLDSILHQKILHLSHLTNSAFHINPIQEYLSLVPELCWENPNLERINVPGIILDTNWTYRLKTTLEEIANNPTLKTLIKEILPQS